MYKEIYADIPRHLRDAVRSKRPEICRKTFGFSFTLML